MLPYFKSLISCQQLCYCLQGMVWQGKEWEEEENEGGEYRMQALHKLEAKDESKDSSSNYSPVLLELFRNIHEDSSVLQLKFKERSCCYIDHFRQFWTWRKSKLWSNEWWARGKSNIHTDFSRSPTVFVPTKRAKVKVNPKLKREKNGTSLIGKTSTVIGAKWKGELGQISRVENWSNHSSTSRPWLNFWSKKCLWNDKKLLTRRKHAQIWT